MAQTGWRYGEATDLENRLISCASHIAPWNRNRRNKYLKDMARQMDVMERFPSAHDSRTAGTFAEALGQYNKLLLQEDVYWRQKAKMYWLKDGDMNTKFFHQSATSKKKFKEIVKLRREDGSSVSDQHELGEIAKSYFETLFTASAGIYEPVIDSVKIVINEEDNGRFIGRFYKSWISYGSLRYAPI